MQHAEAELGPIAHRAVMSYIQSRLAALGLTQPQYWVLRHLCPTDPAPDAAGRTVAELATLMRAYLDDGHDPEPDVAALVADGAVTRDTNGRLALTEAGRRAHARVKEQAPAIHDRIHDGIEDADYATMLRVLRRIIHNTTTGTPGTSEAPGPSDASGTPG